ncbi:MAG TPA: hypothetical protein VNE63_15805 [Candidatus Acidoferrales bacterium]|nr:hypothetical protein [Candidatus Acidoferrales bacterium]
MKLARASANLLAATVLSFCLAPGLLAQSHPAPKSARKARATAAKHPAAPANTAAPSAQKPEPAAGKRDPFSPLITDKKPTGNIEHLPPGKAGLEVATVQVEGTVQAADGMIAVVANPEQHVYFIREGDHLYDGDVEKIGLDGVTFRQNSKDAFGKPVERIMTKRIYASAGEQQ